MGAPKRVLVPASIDDARGRLIALDGIATAAGWERAAIVFAFTRDGRGSPKNPGLGILCQDFAKLGIQGLSSKNSVTLYRDNWKAAIEQGEATEVKPGDRITLPDIDWPATRTGTDGYNSAEGARKTMRKIAEKHPKVVVDVVEDDEEVQEELTKRAATRNARHKKTVDEESKGLKKVAKRAQDAYDQADTDQTDATAQTVVRLTRLVHEAEVTWALTGGIRDGSIISALSELQAAVDGWRQRATGTGEVTLTEEDQAWADELGIDLGVTS